MLKSQNLKQKPFWQIFNSWESSPSPLGPQKIFTRVHLAARIILLCFIAPITQPALPLTSRTLITRICHCKNICFARGKNICMAVWCWRHGGLPSTAGQHAAVCGLVCAARPVPARRSCVGTAGTRYGLISTMASGLSMILRGVFTVPRKGPY